MGMRILGRQPLKNLVIRMGGFHVALNFLAVIGKKFQESGIEDVLTELLFSLWL